MYGGEGATPVVGRGVPLPASEVRAAGFGLFDPRVSTEEFSARFASYRAARSESVEGDRRRDEYSRVGNGGDNDAVVRELMEQNRRMMEQMNRMETRREEERRRAEEQRAEDQRRSNDLQRQLTQALNNVAVSMVAAAPRQPVVERKLQDVAMAQIPEFYGRRDEYATEWVELVNGIASSYDWTNGQRRQAAVAKLRGSARDWYVTYGQGALEDWDDWRDAFLEAFGNTLTMDQWVAQVKGKVRQEGETVRAYCYSKVRICARYPGGLLSEPEVIRYLTLGMRNVQAESLILAARPRTLDDVYITIREWEEFAVDREAEPAYQSTSRPVDIPTLTARDGSRSPTLEKINSLVDRVDKLQSQWDEVGTRFKRPATPVSPGTLSGFSQLQQHPGQASQGGKQYGSSASQGSYRPPITGPPNQSSHPSSTAPTAQSFRPQSAGLLSQQMNPPRPSVQFAAETQSVQPRRAPYGACYRCGQLGHIGAHCPTNNAEDRGQYPRSSSGNA